ncbi:ATP-dependent zinc metalloprotease FtsH homolog [Talaromyces islandicus]|uniref:ATP-dependent zinc metalloprotease FtsH homolog n=1 Tax=Talaromyces islandicus TaxID=28573 RepID=A0A0U1M9Y3_TALIS|nr:ATP-dependent zinc metalloprotease FtsH homolog [Talaromyces islandicus]
MDENPQTESQDNIFKQKKMANFRRQAINTLKEWIAEENEDPQGPISQKMDLDYATIVELDHERDSLESRLRCIYIEKLQGTHIWKKDMEDLPLSRLREMRAPMRSATFTIGDATHSETVMKARQTRYMASSHWAHKAPSGVHMTTPPESPKKDDHNQLLVNAIRGVILDVQSSANGTAKAVEAGSPPDPTYSAGSQYVTVGYLTELLEAALKAQGQTSPGQLQSIDVEHGGVMNPPTSSLSSPQDQLPAGSKHLLPLLLQLVNDGHPSPVVHRDWDDETETDDSSQYAIQRFSESRCVEAEAPPEAPSDTLQTAPREPIAKEDLSQLLADVLADVLERMKSHSISDGPRPAGPDRDESAKQKEDRPRICASKMEWKTVNEIWDPKEYAYKVSDSPPVQDVTKLDEYIFVVRRRIDKKTDDATYFVDIKSPGLRDILRVVLKEIGTVDLETDKPAIERNTLFHFLQELKAYARPNSGTEVSTDAILHLNLLVQHLEEAYQSTMEQLQSLMSYQKITWNLLWALFKPGALVFMTCPSTGLPRCVQYNAGEVKKTIRNVDCFEIQGHYLDFNGEIFGESTETLQIDFFRGAKRIDSLPVYPLSNHPDPAIQTRLVSNGQRFVSLMASHHCRYEGNMFVLFEKEMMKLPIKSDIIVDAKTFREMNPNYPKLETKKPDCFDMWGGTREGETEDRVQPNGLDVGAMKEVDLIRCSPTVLGFSLNEKVWGEFAVENIQEAVFSSAPFEMLSIPEEKKRVIEALTKSRVDASDEVPFDDIIAGKGQGVVILLHGPPGTGKTLTAEAIAQLLQRPLYSISSADLSTNAEQLEVQLTRHFRTARRWRAVLLLDEADVYLQQRDGIQLERNRLVVTFLRTLEYYSGIFFLTTNMLGTFDTAITDRIQLKLLYENLDYSARRKVFCHFLDQANAQFEEEDLDQFVEIRLNGRQIKNIVKIAHNVASSENVRTSSSHLRAAISANGYTIPTNTGAITCDDDLYAE